MESAAVCKIKQRGSRRRHRPALLPLCVYGGYPKILLSSQRRKLEEADEPNSLARMEIRQVIRGILLFILSGSLCGKLLHKEYGRAGVWIAGNDFHPSGQQKEAAAPQVGRVQRLFLDRIKRKEKRKSI